MSKESGMLLAELIQKRTPRVENLRDKCVEAVPQICTERARLVTEAYRFYSSQPIMMKRAKSLDHILNHMSIYIQEGELLVGNHSEPPESGPRVPRVRRGVSRERDRLVPSCPGDPFRITDEAKKELLKICAAWKGNTVRERVLAMLPEVTRKAGEDGVGAYDSEWTLYCGDGHIAPDYPRALREGMKGIVAAIARSSRASTSESHRAYRSLSFSMQRPRQVTPWSFSRGGMLHWPEKRPKERATLCKSRSSGKLHAYAKKCRRIPRRRSARRYNRSGSFISSCRLKRTVIQYRWGESTSTSPLSTLRTLKREQSHRRRRWSSCNVSGSR